MGHARPGLGQMAAMGEYSTMSTALRSMYWSKKTTRSRWLTGVIPWSDTITTLVCNVGGRQAHEWTTSERRVDDERTTRGRRVGNVERWRVSKTLPFCAVFSPLFRPQCSHVRILSRIRFLDVRGQ